MVTVESVIFAAPATTDKGYCSMEFDYDTINCDVKNFVNLPTGKGHYSNEIDPWFMSSHPEHNVTDTISKEAAIYNKDNRALRTVVSSVHQGDICEKENISEFKPEMQIKLNKYRTKKDEVISTNNKGNKLSVNKRSSSSIIQSESKRVKAMTLEKKSEKNVVANIKANKVPTIKTTIASTGASNLNKVKGADDDKVKKKCQLDDTEDLETKELIKQFNLKRLPKAKYEPPRHSVRLVRQWEKVSGKLFANLNTEEREQANTEISKLKENL